MLQLIKTLLIPLMLFCVAACERNKNLDIEPLASGDYVVRVTGSLFGEPAETLRQRAADDAKILCRRDGRVAEIKNIKIVPDQYSRKMTAEGEFGCAPRKVRS